jgi:hypothetical protein
MSNKLGISHALEMSPLDCQQSVTQSIFPVGPMQVGRFNYKTTALMWLVIFLSYWP